MDFAAGQKCHIKIWSNHILSFGKRNNDFELCNTSHVESGNRYPQIVPNKDRDLVLEYIKDNHESIPRKASYVHMYITTLVIWN